MADNLTAAERELEELRDAAKQLDNAICGIREKFDAEMLARLNELDRAGLDIALARVRRCLKAGS